MTKNNEGLTKQVTEKVFDLDKVGVGDIVEFPYDVDSGFGKVLTEYKAGIVIYSDKYSLKVFTHEPGDLLVVTHRPKNIDIKTIYAKDAGEVRLLYRSYHNATWQGVDTYGRRD